MPLEALRWIRKMRGGSQAHLILASDGHQYVVKFKQNAQHRRILVNEMVSSVILNFLEIPTARTGFIQCRQEFFEENPGLEITMGKQRLPIQPGLHFGSRMPVDPDRFVIYDNLPDRLLKSVANFRDFVGVLVFDRWASNIDMRQCVLFRAQVRDWTSVGEGSGKVAFVAMMMDHGFLFGGPSWELDDLVATGVYHRHVVYHAVRGLDSFQPWLDMAMNLPTHVLDEAFRSVPEWWLNGDREELERLLERLYKRRRRIPDLIEMCKQGRTNPFANWP